MRYLVAWLLGVPGAVIIVWFLLSTSLSGDRSNGQMIRRNARERGIVRVPSPLPGRPDQHVVESGIGHCVGNDRTWSPPNP
jgi:hypothetical protein